MTEPLTPTFVQAPLAWGDIDRVPVLAANQFLMQIAVNAGQGDPSDVVLTVGYVPPPLLIGTPEEQQATLAALDHLNVRTVGRFSIPAGKAAELAEIIQDLLRRIEAGRPQP